MVVIGRRTEVGRDPQDIAVGFGSVWVANRGDGTLTRLDAGTGRPQGPPIRVGGAPGALAVTRDAVLVLDTKSGAVQRVDPKIPRRTRNHENSGLPCRYRGRCGRGVGRRLPARHRHANLRLKSRPHRAFAW